MNHISPSQCSPCSLHPIVVLFFFVRFPYASSSAIVGWLSQGKRLLYSKTHSFCPRNLSFFSQHNIPWAESLESRNHPLLQLISVEFLLLHEYYKRKREKVFLLILPDSNFLLFFIHSFNSPFFSLFFPNDWYMYSSPETSPSSLLSFSFSHRRSKVGMCSCLMCVAGLRRCLTPENSFVPLQHDYFPSKNERRRVNWRKMMMRKAYSDGRGTDRHTNTHSTRIMRRWESLFFFVLLYCTKFHVLRLPGNWKFSIREKRGDQIIFAPVASDNNNTPSDITVNIFYWKSNFLSFTWDQKAIFFPLPLTNSILRRGFTHSHTRGYIRWDDDEPLIRLFV